MPSVKKSVILSVFSNFGNLAISLVLVIIVSRILPPAVIGSYIMAYSVLMFIDPIRELQLQSYVIQRETIDRQSLRPVSFVSLVTSLASVAICGIGSMVFYFTYDTPAVGNCLLIMGLAFLLRPFSQVPLALLSRDMRYDAIAIVKMGSAFAKAAVTLGFIFMTDLEAEALAAGIFAEIAAELIALAMVERNFRFSRPAIHGSREVFQFCLQFSGAQLFNRVSVSLIQILIGAFQGLAVIAYYNRGKALVTFFRSGVEKAILPIALSQFSRGKNDRAVVRQSYFAAISALTGVSWPALVCFAVLAEPIIFTLFGPQWGRSIYLAQVLSLGAIVFAATALSQQAHAAVGETRILLMREGFMLVPRLVVLAATAPISAEAVAWGIFATNCLQFVVNQRLLTKSLGFPITEFARAVAKSAMTASATGLAAYLSMTYMNIVEPEWQRLLLHGSVGGIVWIAMLFATRHPLAADLVTPVRKRLFGDR